MAQDNEIRLSISAEADESSIARAKRSLDGLEGSVKDVADEIKKAGRVGDFSEVVSGAQKVENAVDDATNSVKKLGQELKSATDVANDRFQTVSNNVALAGDAESAINTIGGAAGAFGGTGVQQALGGGAEVFAVIEAAPRLKEAFAGLPATIGSAVTALGPVGLAFAAVSVALFAVGSAAQKAAEDVKRATRERLAAENEIAQQIAGGLTTQEAQNQIEYLRKLQQEQTDLLIEAENERKEAFQRSVDEALGTMLPGVFVKL
jgi:uncharacterized protein YoxC